MQIFIIINSTLAKLSDEAAQTDPVTLKGRSLRHGAVPPLNPEQETKAWSAGPASGARGSRRLASQVPSATIGSQRNQSSARHEAREASQQSTVRMPYLGLSNDEVAQVGLICDNMRDTFVDAYVRKFGRECYTAKLAGVRAQAPDAGETGEGKGGLKLEFGAGAAADKAESPLAMLLKRRPDRAVRTANLSVLTAGWLTKKGEVRKNWKRRWFELDNHYHLRYFEGDDGSKGAKGACVFYNYRIEAPVDVDGRSCIAMLHGAHFSARGLPAARARANLVLICACASRAQTQSAVSTSSRIVPLRLRTGSHSSRPHVSRSLRCTCSTLSRPAFCLQASARATWHHRNTQMSCESQPSMMASLHSSALPTSTT
eukprot:SAG11_NODE_557_length_8549_cov_5.574675_3_plen_372_part_00